MLNPFYIRFAALVFACLSCATPNPPPPGEPLITLVLIEERASNGKGVLQVKGEAERILTLDLKGGFETSLERSTSGGYRMVSVAKRFFDVIEKNPAEYWISLEDGHLEIKSRREDVDVKPGSPPEDAGERTEGNSAPSSARAVDEPSVPEIESCDIDFIRTDGGVVSGVVSNVVVRATELPVPEVLVCGVYTGENFPPSSSRFAEGVVLKMAKIKGQEESWKSRGQALVDINQEQQGQVAIVVGDRIVDPQSSFQEIEIWKHIGNVGWPSRYAESIDSKLAYDRRATPLLPATTK